MSIHMSVHSSVRIFYTHVPYISDCPLSLTSIPHVLYPCPVLCLYGDEACLSGTAQAENRRKRISLRMALGMDEFEAMLAEDGVSAPSKAEPDTRHVYTPFPIDIAPRHVQCHAPSASRQDMFNTMRMRHRAKTCSMPCACGIAPRHVQCHAHAASS